jgi:adenylate cyclase
MERRLTAILAADVVGYSRLMGVDEAGTLAAVKAIRNDLIEHNIAQHQGRIVKLMGDGILAEFPSVVNAVSCAVEIQRGLRERNANIPQERCMQFRIGVNLGDVIVENDDIHGDGVNVAARLQSIAPPDGIAVSQSVRDHVGNRLAVAFEDCGEQELRNIEKPIRVYNVLLEEPESDAMPLPKKEKPSIAVLPFTNMSGDPEQEYFSDGITEDIITDLSKVSGLFVIARHSAFTYKGKAVKVDQVGRDLGVAYVLEGSVRKAGTRVRVTGQLINAKDGDHLWAERFDRDLTDIFTIQDEITHAIVEQLKVKLLPQEKKSIAQTPTDNLEAYNYYLKGRELLRRGSKSGYKAAREVFAKAVELDPSYARAYAGIADCDSFLYSQTAEAVSPESSLAMSEKALSLDNSLAEAHASRGAALSVVKRFVEAAAEFEKAIRPLDPNSFEAYYFYARACVFQGKIEQATELFERAAKSKPDDYQCMCLLPQWYHSLGRHEDAIEAPRKGAKLAERQLILHPDDARAAELGAPCLIEIGELDRAREWIARALTIEPNNALTNYNAACGYAQLGDIDQALDLLERGLPNSGPEWSRWIEHDSSLDPLRNHSRYRALLEILRRRERERG